MNSFRSVLERSKARTDTGQRPRLVPQARHDGVGLRELPSQHLALERQPRLHRCDLLIHGIDLRVEPVLDARDEACRSDVLREQGVDGWEYTAGIREQP